MKPKRLFVYPCAIILALSLYSCANNTSQENASPPVVTETSAATRNAPTAATNTSKSEAKGSTDNVLDNSTAKLKPDDEQVTFRYNVPLGYKYRTVSQDKQTFRSGGNPSIGEITTVGELTKVENEQYTWKTTTTEEIKDWGDTTTFRGKGFAKNRIVFTTDDSAGNTIKQEGAEPGYEKLEGNDYPTSSIRLGETWRTVVKEADYLDQSVSNYTLESIATINGKRYAVISDRFEGGTTGRGKRWIDLSTGLLVKSEYDYEGKNEAGEVYDYIQRLNMVDEKGDPILP